MATTPGPARVLRSQGLRTKARLLEAGMQVLGERGYRATRVDDVVGRAATSHGTFYLYFQNVGEMFRALAHVAADDMAALADELGPIAPDAGGRKGLRTFLGRFLETYERHGPVIRAWAENQVDDPDLISLGLDTFGGIASVLRERMDDAGVTHLPDAAVATTVLLGTIERLVYYATSRPLELDDGALLDELAGMLHRGFFGASR
ncbi:MAG: TetR/AcrR family transcriptional regulator [Acidimicrobiia bacterium]|nr:TetR/AcrR family transcriptional regulator [Acidimicrobiia bacterium]